ncbi:hypothetical protein NQ176_g5395 [Zarea fungicola]|uniref:Uncharacterized protein n=1 Tax=Zarea fungicola TaxID=93591 RepID=A0ACC1N9H5_9HYPO|nr:hypothetical protein NQ176_g5395 [Lecanicillium fungicola]
MGIVETLLERVSVKSVLAFVAGALLLRQLAVRWDERIRLNRLGKRGKSLETWVPWGLDFVYSAITATAAHKNLEWWHGLFGTAGRWTLETRAVNQRIVITADPENIKAILATQFVDFGKGEPFHRDWQDFLGDSIFTTDGEMWHNSRQLIRPQFTRDRVSDLECFEKHMQTLFRAIANGGPLDGADQVVSSSASGKVLDIADLFFRYTLDVATEFLLGSDVQSLTTIDQEFARAFNDVQRLQNIFARAGDLRPWIPKASFWKGLGIMNEFVNHFIDMALRLKPEELKNSKSGKELESTQMMAEYVFQPHLWYRHHYRYANSVIHRIALGERLTKSTKELADLQDCVTKFVGSIGTSLIDWFPALAGLPGFLMEAILGNLGQLESWSVSCLGGTPCEGGGQRSRSSVICA